MIPFVATRSDSVPPRLVRLFVLLPCVSCATVIDSGQGAGSGGAGVDATGQQASGGTSFASGGTRASGGGPSTGGGVATGGTPGAGNSTSLGGQTGSGGNDDQVLGGTELFFDDFESGDDDWTLLLDGWSVTSDGSMVLSQDTLENTTRLAHAGEAWADQVVEARVKVTEFGGSSSSYYAAVYARVQDGDNAYFLALQSNGDVKIRKRAGGNETSISSGAEFATELDTWYTLRFHAVGTLLTGYVNGQPIITGSDATFDSGGVGVGTKNARAVFDDVRVTTPE